VLSTSHRARTAKPAVAPPAPEAPPVETGSSLRGDLESVWAISASDGEGAAVAAVLAFAAAILHHAAAEPDRHPPADEAAVVAATVGTVAGMTTDAARRALFRDASRRLALVEGSPSVVFDAQLRLLVMLAPVTAGSVWLQAPDGRAQAVAACGPLATTRRCKEAAAEVLAGDVRPLENGRVRVHAYPLHGRGGLEGALVVRVAPDGYADALPFIEELALAFGSVLERDRLLRANAGADRRLEQAYERRLVRTAFDLHDGPLQEVAALGDELRRLRLQIEQADELRHDLLVGRVDDLTARLVEVDHSLRSITASLETATLDERPLLEALRRHADVFEGRSGATVNVATSGRFDELTMSQRIAVVRVVQEALSNIREHSHATHVDISVCATGTRLTLQVSDNGRGFDVRETATAAARRGRLGIVGMNERVRLLGGVFSIDSVPGAGTTVSASIPAWRPLA
jgi:signal transduction histidine kinase